MIYKKYKYKVYFKFLKFNFLEIMDFILYNIYFLFTLR